MNSYTADELRELVKYDEDTAGGLMTTDYTWIYAHRTTEATIRKIREIAPDVGVHLLPLRPRQERPAARRAFVAPLLLALPTAFIDRIMDTDLVTVHPDATAVEVAATIARYDLLAVPVVDDHGKMLGIVTVDDAIDAIMPDDVAKKLPRFTARRHSHVATRRCERGIAAVVDPRPKRRSLTRTLLLVAAVLGPGFVAASAGNDVGGIATYSAAGAQFGYSILWVMIPLAVALIVVQEMSTRMGCVTGKGLAALFRENFGVKISFFAMAMLFLINTMLTATEFAGIAGAAEIFHISRYIARSGDALRGLLLRAALRQQDRRARLRRFLARVPELHRLRSSRQAELEWGRARNAGPDLRTANARMADDGGRADRYDDLAVHAVLLPIGRRR